MKVLWFFILFLSLGFLGCSETPLEEQPGFDGYPLRSATPDEGKHLKECHQAIHVAEKRFFGEHHTYTPKVSSLGVESECSKLSVMVRTHERGYLAVARINSDRTTVRWLSDETGKVFEELEDGPDPNKMTPGDDSEFGFGF